MPKISALPAIPTPILSPDIFPVVQSGVTYKMTLGQLLNLGAAVTAIDLATSSPLSGTYNNGSSGVGATLTSVAVGILSIDGVSPVVGQLVLVKNQTIAFQNGIYTVTNIGSVSSNWILTRSSSFNTASQLYRGSFFTINFGVSNGKTQWFQTSSVSTIGSDAINYESNVVAGSGVSKVNNTLSVPPGGLNASAVSSNTQMVSNRRYFVSSSGAATNLTLPTTGALNDLIEIQGVGTFGWKILQGAGQQIIFSSTSTTVGVTGSVTSANSFDSVRLVCIDTGSSTRWCSLGGPQTAGFTIV